MKKTLFVMLMVLLLTASTVAAAELKVGDSPAVRLRKENEEVGRRFHECRASAEYPRIPRERNLEDTHQRKSLVVAVVFGCDWFGVAFEEPQYRFVAHGVCDVDAEDLRVVDSGSQTCGQKSS